MEMRTFREKLASGSPQLGMVLRSADPVMSEITALAGFDFGWIDMEHSPISLGIAQTAILALLHYGCVPLVRVPSTDANMIGQLLDMGAQIINVPHIESRLEAEMVANAARFYPLGKRGFSSTTRTNRYGKLQTTAEQMDTENQRVLVMVQIESQRGMDNLDEIATVPGIDILFLGTGDLSQDLGLPGQQQHPKVIAAVERFAERARHAGKPAALPISGPTGLKQNLALGYSMFACGVDLSLIRGAMESLVSSLRAEIDG